MTTYLKKVSFDNKNWYQLQWNDVDFKEFDECGRDCNSIEEYASKILESFPHSQFEYKPINRKKK